jgi:hypothetical protein
MASIEQIKYETNHQVAPWWCGNRYCWCIVVYYNSVFHDVTVGR